MRLSKLQKHILTTIANHTINDLECDEYYEHGRDQMFIGHRELYYTCREYWKDSHWTTAKTSFSRALRTLMEKDLIGALALQWRFLTRKHDDAWGWQGQGKKRFVGVIDIGNGTVIAQRSNVPRYRMICLTEEGWKVARSMGNPDAGKCEHVLHREQRKSH